MIIDFLARAVNNLGATIQLETPVTAIEWQRDLVTLKAAHHTFLVKKVIITVPLGVLQAQTIVLSPDVPQLHGALDQLGYGTAIKILLSFENAFWQADGELKDLSMLFSKEIIPTWWTQYPKDVPVLVGRVAGGQAKNLVFLKKEVLPEKALQSLAVIFDTPLDTIKDGEIKETMRAGIENTVFFAGEGWFDGLESGIVEAALHSGRDTARHIIAHY